MNYAKKTKQENTKPRTAPGQNIAALGTSHAHDAYYASIGRLNSLITGLRQGAQPSRGTGQEGSGDTPNHTARGQTGQELFRRNRKVPVRPSPKGLASRSGPILRTYTVRGESTADGPPKPHEVRRSILHPNFKSFASAPINKGSSWGEGGFHELEVVKEDGRHLRMKGRLYLAPAYVMYDAAGGMIDEVGQRIAVIPLSPASLGGRLQLMAETYTSHRCLRFEVVYSPVVPTTEPGALAMYYTPDIAESQFLTGLPLLNHAVSCDKHFTDRKSVV